MTLREKSFLQNGSMNGSILSNHQSKLAVCEVIVSVWLIQPGPTYLRYATGSAEATLALSAIGGFDRLKTNRAAKVDVPNAYTCRVQISGGLYLDSPTFVAGLDIVV